MATHSSLLTWKIPGKEEPSGLNPWGQKESDTTENTEYRRTYRKFTVFACFFLILPYILIDRMGAITAI